MDAGEDQEITLSREGNDRLGVRLLITRVEDQIGGFDVGVMDKTGIVVDHRDALTGMQADLPRLELPSLLRDDVLDYDRRATWGLSQSIR